MIRTGCQFTLFVLLVMRERNQLANLFEQQQWCESLYIYYCTRIIKCQFLPIYIN